MTQPQSTEATEVAHDDNQLIPLYRSNPRAVAYAVWQQLRDKASVEGHRYSIDGVTGWQLQCHLRDIVRIVFPDYADDAKEVGTFTLKASENLKRWKLISMIERGGGGGQLAATWFVADQWPSDLPKIGHPDSAATPASAPEPEPASMSDQTAPASRSASDKPDVARGAEKFAELEQVLSAYISDKMRERTDHVHKELKGLRDIFVGIRDAADEATSRVDRMIGDLDGTRGGDQA